MGIKIPHIAISRPTGWKLWASVALAGLIGAYVALMLIISAIFDWYPAAPAGAQIPHHFWVSEDYSSSWPFRRLSFHVEADGRSYGDIYHDWPSMALTFKYYDQSGKTQALAEYPYDFRQMFATRQTIYDGAGKHLYTVDKDLTASMVRKFSGRNVYEVKDADGKVIAISDKATVGLTAFTLHDPITDEVIATATRSFRYWKFLGDSWEVQINRDNVDPRILIVLAMSKSFDELHGD